MEMDRQAIERRDFPIVRRGYEPAAVDAHLRALAGEIEQLSRGLASGEQPSLASAASAQVQSILHAAETAAADIEREALQHAAEVRGDADRDAEQTREQAIAKSRSHLAAVAQATATLLERVEAVDGEVSALLESLRGGAERLTCDLGVDLSRPDGPAARMRDGIVLVETKSERGESPADRVLAELGLEPISLSKYRVGMSLAGNARHDEPQPGSELFELVE